MGELARLIPQEDLSKVNGAIERSIRSSFEEDTQRSKSAKLPPPSMTRGEVKRRFAICLNIYKMLRGDLKWGMKRALDHLPRYLRNSLDGVQWEPDKRSVWAPGDG